MDDEEPVVIASPAVGSRIQELQTERWVRTMVLLVIGGPLLFALNLGIAIKASIDSGHRDRLIRQGISCLLADLDDHRHTNQGAHDALADAAHIKIVQPDVIPLTKEEAQILKGSCERFVQNTLGQSLPRGHEAERRESEAEHR
jgi:hypothetical protein